MVLHNNKWDRRATKRYNKKHGIVTKSNRAGSPGQERGVSSSDRDSSECSEEDSGEDLEEQNFEESKSEEAAELELDPKLSIPLENPGALDAKPRRRRKNLPSNAWRYAEIQDDDGEVSQDYSGILSSESAVKGLSKYLANSGLDDGRPSRSTDFVDLQPDTFESDLHTGGDWKSKDRKIIYYNPADDSNEFVKFQAKIDKFQFADRVKERYLSADRREQEQELARLKRLPKSVAHSAMKSRIASMIDKKQNKAALDEQFDEFWAEMNDKDSEITGSATQVEFTGTPVALGNLASPSSNQTAKSTDSSSWNRSAAQPNQKPSTHLPRNTHTPDDDDVLLDALLNAK
ncbi:uncharacterized protein V1516DRAFT_667446 [Lipomyces oligophaga]|uniref:uncharacterized protein n=1 Tax=Lipomyces oligophaga TaxID=45792 RepID=UPI0034CFDF34